MRAIVAIASLVTSSLLVGACAPEEAEEAERPEEAVSRAMPTGTRVTALAVDTLEEAGPYLTDGQGHAIYLLEADTAGVSTCVDACARTWPPALAAEGGPSAAAPSVRAELIGTVRRPDGSEQVTYGGHPLYHYAEDEGPGTTSGQDVHDRWGEWYLVRPSGEKLEETGGGG